MSQVDLTKRADGPARRPSWTALFGSTEAGLVLAILSMLALLYTLPAGASFFGERSLGNLYHNTALFGVLAVGAAIVIVAGGIDLSVGSVVALSAVVGVRLMTDWLPGGSAARGPLPAWIVAAGFVASLALGAGVGLLHALMINLLRLPPFIATLATMAGLRSLANLISENKPWNISSRTFRAFGDDNRYTVPIFFAVALAASLMMGVTVLGRHLYALGGNEKAARLCGLRTGRLKATAYVLSGMIAALAGLLFAGSTGQADYRMGTTYELYAITAAVVGGCSLAGGAGSIRGTVLGLILLQVVIKGTGLVVTSVDPSRIEGLILGVIVIAAVAFKPMALVRFLSRLLHGLDLPSLGGSGTSNAP